MRFFSKQILTLSHTDMIQRNEVSGTERPVRRRPVFVSSEDVHISRTRWRWSFTSTVTGWCRVWFSSERDFVWLFARKNTSARPHVFKCVPGFWDQSAIPDCGFQVQFSSLNRCSLEMIDFTCIHSLVCREFVSIRLTEITPEFRISSVRLWALSPSDRLSVYKTENSGESSSRECQFKNN